MTVSADSGTQSPSRTYQVRAAGSASARRTVTAPDSPVVSRTSRRPCASYATDSPVNAACTTGRPVSAARSAPSEACWAGAHVDWKVDVADW